MKRSVWASKAFLILFLTLGITSCSSSLGVVTSLLTDTPSISAQVGEEANKQIVGEQNKLEAEGDINQADNQISKASEVVFNQGPSLPVLVFLVLGWLAPSPGSMYKEVKSWFKTSKI